LNLHGTRLKSLFSTAKHTKAHRTTH